VPYTVWSRGHLIGDTDLAFVRISGAQRSGSFHPNAEGERLMSVIASVLPAMRAHLHRDEVDAQGHSLVQPALHGSALFADLAEAFQHLQSLDLELRREDGSVVPTTDIGIQDTHQLLELAAEDLNAVDVGSWDEDHDALESFEHDLLADADVMSDAELIEQALEESIDNEAVERMMEALAEPRVPRYHIHVLLRHDTAIP